MAGRSFTMKASCSGRNVKKKARATFKLQLKDFELFTINRFEAKDHPDVKSGHPEAFIRGTLGYDLWDGFGYGTKPGRLETMFELHTIKDTFPLMAMILWLPYIAILIAPFAGGLVGLIVNKKQGSGAIDIPGGHLYNSSSEIQ